MPDMLTRPTPSLWRTLAIAGVGLTAPLLWPGVLQNLLTFDARPHLHAAPRALDVLTLTADLLIGVAYTVIAGILGWIVYRNRQHLPFDWVVLAFGLFIVACGMTHVMHIVTRTWPLYWLDGYVRGLTAVVSVATAAALPPLIPRVGTLLTAERTLVRQQRELERSNAALREAAERSDLLAALGDALQGARTGADVQQAALDQLGPALHASSMIVVLLDGSRARPTMVWGQPTGRTADLIARESFDVQEAPVLARTLQTGEATYLEEYQRLPGAHPDLQGAYGLEPILDAAGRVMGGVAAWRRAGPWTAGEQDLLRRAAGTVGLALERAHAITELARQHEQLTLSNRNLERSNADLDRFAAIASHDLKAPIRAVTSFAELLSAKYASGLDERGQRYLAQVRANGYHMERLVNDLLTYSRAAVTDPVLTDVPLDATVQDVLARLRPDLTATRATVSTGALPVVVGDAAQLDRLFQNLVVNALKYRSGAAPHVQISADLDGEGLWRFDVTDNGQGIAPEYHERIFDLFARLHHRDVEGTGLGLAICRRIVEHHGGRIWLTSTPGQGSTFSFTLPVRSLGAPPTTTD